MANLGQDRPQDDDFMEFIISRSSSKLDPSMKLSMAHVTLEQSMGFVQGESKAIRDQFVQEAIAKLEEFKKGELLIPLKSFPVVDMMPRERESLVLVEKAQEIFDTFSRWIEAKAQLNIDEPTVSAFVNGKEESVQSAVVILLAGEDRKNLIAKLNATKADYVAQQDFDRARKVRQLVGWINGERIPD